MRSPTSSHTVRRFGLARVAGVALAFTLGSGLAGCGESPSETSSPAELDESVASAVLETASGGQFDMGSLQGKDAVLWFWAPW